MYRDSFTDREIEILLPLIRTKNISIIEFFFGNIFEVFAKAIRSMIQAPPGYEFFCGDFCSVEGYILAWIAGETHILEAINAGQDMYVIAAAAILQLAYESITKEQRQYPGKVAELACGYNGGAGAARKFGADGKTERTENVLKWINRYGLSDETVKDRLNDFGYNDYFQKKLIKTWKDYSFKEVEKLICDEEINATIIRPWRDNRPATVEYWKQTEVAAKQALNSPGQTVFYGKCNWYYSVKDNFLYCQLPSGRLLSYYDPIIQNRMQPWGKMADVITFLGVKTVDGRPAQWTRLATYGGKLSENIDQGIAADLLRYAMVEEEKNNFPICLHVHDELLSLVPTKDNRSFEEFIFIMSNIRPPWAEGLPIKAEGWRGFRYKKG
jgi:DNA polymerase